MRLKEGFVLRDVCGENVICAEGVGTIDFGRLLVANETATCLWKYAESQGDFTVESLAAALCQEYEIGEDTARKDVADIVTKWQELGILAD